MSVLWEPYIPDLFIAQLTRQVDPIGQEQRLAAVVLFVDVSGFSRMSEALGYLGKIGTEELTRILNAFFVPMIDEIESYGGVIGKFGGDALTVLFPYTAASQLSVVPRAAQCGLAIQTRAAEFAEVTTKAGTFRLAVKVGGAMGEALLLVVGQRERRLEYIIAGAVLDRSAESEHAAEAGDVVVENALIPLLGSSELQPRGAGFTRINRIMQPEPPIPALPSALIPDDRLPVLRAFLHPVVAAQIEKGQQSFLGEHRKVTVVFVRFDGFDYDGDAHVGDKLQAYAAQVIDCIHRYDGYLNKIDMGDKGSKFIALFGTPVAHENDEARALRCALEISQIKGVVMRIGVNTGFVYCGLVGSASRQEYTVMGDAVNLAARLMQAAQPSQVLVSLATQHSAGLGFDWQALPAIMVKGKEQPVELFELKGVRTSSGNRLAEPVYTLEMVGRTAELSLAKERLSLARMGEGQLVSIRGEAGIGKSRLTAEVVREARQQGFVVSVGECQSYGMNSSFLVWQKIWRDLLDVDDDLDDEAVALRLRTGLAAIDERLVQRLPLLAPVLNLPIAENDLTELLDARTFRELQHDLLFQILRHRTQQSPLLLVLEDCHWIDPLSLDFLEYLAPNAAELSLALLVIYRPNDLTQPLLTLPNHTLLDLAEFSVVDIERLIALKVSSLFGSGETLPRAFIDQVIARANGNPFFAEEIINYIHGRGIVAGDLTALSQVDLPASLHSLIISRIDQLVEDERNILRAASVVGRLFRANWIWGAFTGLGSPDFIQRRLESLSRFDITPLLSPDPELEYIFKHIITQEVAYDSLAFSTREMLHEQIAAFVEVAYADHLESYTDLLAFHYGRSRNVNKQRGYFRRAADAAKEVFANDSAIHFYQRLLPLLSDEQKSEVLLKLADVLKLVGRWSEAEAHYRTVLQLAEVHQDVRSRAHAESALGERMGDTTSLDEAQIWLDRARQTFDALGDDEGLARTLQRLGLIYLRKEQHAQALEICQRQMQVSERLGDIKGIFEINSALGWIHVSRGDYALAEKHLREALQLADDENYRMGMVLALNDLAGVCYMKGDLGQSLSNCQQGLAIASDIGWRREVGRLIGNSGAIYHLCGYFSEALQCYAYGLEINLELNDLRGVSLCCANIASIYAETDRVAAASMWNELMLPITQNLDTSIHLELLNNQAHLLTRNGQFQQAESYLAQVLALCRQTGNAPLELKARLLEVRLKVRLGQMKTEAALKQLVTMSHDLTNDEVLADLYYTIYQLQPDSDARSQAAERYQRLYEATPNIEYRKRFRNLTGNPLAEPPRLPALPPDVTNHNLNVEELLDRIREQYSLKGESI